MDCGGSAKHRGMWIAHRRRGSLRAMLRMVLVAQLALVGCAYPQRTTALMPVRSDVSPSDIPDDLWAFTLVSATVPATQRSGLPWDEGGGRPDPYVKIYRAD